MVPVERILATNVSARVLTLVEWNKVRLLSTIDICLGYDILHP
jgi:hypothetical protein